MSDTLSVILITWNEEERLARTLDSVAWADEIVVVDSESTDGTASVARRYTDRFFVRPWEGFGRQKQRALELARGDWVLSIDADEVVSAELAGAIERVLAEPGEEVGYWIHFHTWMLGRWFGSRGWWREWKLRLSRRDRTRFENPLVHERIEVDGPTGRLPGPLLHYHDRGLHHELDRINRYSTLAARQLHREGRGGGGVLAPLLRALTYTGQRYFLQGGFLYGRAGVVDACLRGTYGFLKYAKHWDLGRRERSGAASSADGR